MKRRVTRVHVNQSILVKNRKNGTDEPAVTVKDSRQNRYAHDVEFLDAQGNVIARLVSRFHDPLSCGARIWIESDYEVRTVVYEGGTAGLPKTSCGSKCKPKTGKRRMVVQ